VTLRSVLHLLWSLTIGTTRVCLRYRVTGLAAEAGFFALLSLPPLLLGLVGGAGYAGRWLRADLVAELRSELQILAETFLTRESVSSVILPTFDDVLDRGRFDIVSIGFVLSLWSGSRALNVYVDTVSIMYGLGGHRGIVRTRALSFSLYLATLVVGTVVIPLVLLGPGFVQGLVGSNEALGTLFAVLYWPVVVVFAVAGLATLYHVATPIRTPWWRDLAGATLALVLWLLVSLMLRIIIAASVDSTSIYGPLSTPIVVLIWLYFLAIAVLIGAALNAALDERFPHPSRVRARETGGAFTAAVPMTPVRGIAMPNDPESAAVPPGPSPAPEAPKTR
jgi:membrane protein